MALDFPNSPSINQVYSTEGASWVWNGTAWIREATITDSINSIGDVVITSVAPGDFLRHDGSNWINDPVNLATDTVGDYVKNLVAGTGVTITNNSGEGATPSIAIGQAVATNSDVTFNSVTSSLVGNASTASALQTSRTIGLTGDVTGSVSFDGSSNVNISTTIAPNSVTLGSDTTGDYVQSLVAGNGITITNNSGESATPNIAVDTGTIATKAYVDAVAVGLYWHEAVLLATAGILPNSPAYDNGTSGVGATLSASTNGRLIVDGANASNNNRILVKNQANPIHNGIYTVTSQGSPSATWVLTRASDSDNSPLGEVKTGDAVYTISGSVNANQCFAITSAGSLSENVFDLGVDSITYTQFSGTSAFTAGDGLVTNGNVVNVATADPTRITVASDNIDLATVTQTNSSASGDNTSFITTFAVDSYGRVTGKTTGSIGQAVGTTSNVSFNTVTSNLLGNVTGNVIGNVTGNLTGNVDGDLTGDVYSQDATPIKIVDSSAKQFTGALTGNVTGNVSGNVTGNVTGDVTGNVTGNAGTASTLQTARTISLGGVLSGSESFNGSSAITIVADYVANSVILGSDTSGNYVDYIYGGTGVTITGSAGEGATPNISIGQAVATTDNVTFASVTSNLLGDVKATDGTTVLDSGTNGTNATFTGSVTGNVTGNASTATTLQNARTIQISGDVAGSASFDGSQNINISATIQANSVALGTDTTGNYMSDVSAGTGISVSHTAGEGSTATVSLNATLDNLSNVNAPSPSDGQFLKYVSASTEWQPANIPTINNLDDVGDVTITSATSGDFLKWSGSAWVNDAIDLSTDTTGSYVQSLVAGTGITLTNNSGEGSTPTVAVDTSVIATKTYVDAAAEGLHIHAPAKAATTGTLASITGGSVTYDNGTNGVGATLTLSSALTTLDNYSLQNGDRIIVKNQATAAHNGIYTWATGGTVLTRASDFNTSTEVAGGDFIFVTEGDTYANTGWVETEAVTNFGSDSIIFLQFSGAGAYEAGTGLTRTGTVFSVNASQTQVTALGTVTTGTWNASVIGSTYGGTGINNGGRTLTINTGNITFTADAGGSTITLPSTGTVATLSGTETLSGKTLSSVVLGTPTSGTLTNCTDLPVSTGISGLGSGIAAFLATPSSSNLISAITDETGTGSLVFGTSPTIATPTLTLSATTSTTNGLIAWDQTNDKIIVGDGTIAVEFAPSTRLTNAQTASYTLVAADKDKIVEVSNASANTVTIPLNSSVAYPIGSEIVVLQTGVGQTTIAGAVGVTVNATPGLKLRAQWSAVTLIKRATDTWVVIGDLSA